MDYPCTEFGDFSFSRFGAAAGYTGYSRELDNWGQNYQMMTFLLLSS